MVKRRKEEEIVGVLEFEGRTSEDPEVLKWLAEHKAQNEGWIRNRDAMVFGRMSGSYPNFAGSPGSSHLIPTRADPDSPTIPKIPEVRFACRCGDSPPRRIE